MFGKNKETEIQIDQEMFMIYDTKVSAYSLPTFSINEHDAVREVLNLFKDPQQSQNKLLLNAEDYSIFKIGGLNKKTGQFYPTIPPQHIANLHDLRSISQKKIQDVGIATT